MEKQEILEGLRSLLETENINEISSDANALIKSFYEIYNKEKSEKEQAEKDLEEEQELEIDPANEKLNEDILELINSFKARRKAYQEELKAEQKRNLDQKKDLLKEFEALIQSEESIGKLFATVKEIRDKWKEVGAIPREVYQDIQSQYSRLNEEFSYNINIYKELQDNDLKKNYSLKNQVIFAAKELANETRIKNLEKKVRQLQNEWDEIGPTYKEYWEKLKEDYWTTIREIYNRIKEHYEGQRNQQKENLEKKLQLIQNVKEIVAEKIENHKGWENTTKQLMAIQDEWKKIGFVPKEENEKIWNEFRGYFNNFFDQKAEFYNDRNSVFNKNADLKKQLIDKVAELSSSTDWKNTGNKIIKLQQDWKKIGHAGKFAEQKLWKEFRSKCDSFFNAKEAHFKQMDEDNEQNLKVKEDIIARIKSYQPQEDSKATVVDLKNFSKEFNNAGNVPFKEKDRIYKEYKDALNGHYDNLKMDEAEKERTLFEAKLDSLKASANPSRLYQQEKDKIRRKINDITKEIANYENNLGFFSNSKGAEALLAGVNKNIEKGKEQIEKLKKQLRMFPKD